MSEKSKCDYSFFADIIDGNNITKDVLCKMCLPERKIGSIIIRLFPSNEHLACIKDFF